MIPSELLTIIGRRHFIAEVRTETAQQALGTVEALARGGIAVFEISVAIPGSSEILHHFASQTEIIVGAGGVTETREAEEAAKAGARFIVAPIMSPELLTACQDLLVTCILGALTPTEILAAQRAGAGMVKVFPANALGGSHYLHSLFRQFTKLNLLASGGITLENLPEYLALPVRAIALGSTLMPRALVERGDWVSIAGIARRYVEYALAWEAATAGAPPPQVAVGRPMMGDTTMMPLPHQMTAPTPPGYGPATLPPQPYPTLPPTYAAGQEAGAFDPAQSAPRVPLAANPRAPAQSGMPPAAAPLFPQQSQPGVSQPGAAQSAPPGSAQPAQAPPATSQPGAEKPPEFKPWDSKPAPGTGGDDWIR
jgi:2-dehydro-3-deoxyphosphogluconate aldolase/(4S)-4-hydroxy-2-oxoglutarate aldolase